MHLTRPAINVAKSYTCLFEVSCSTTTGAKGSSALIGGCVACRRLPLGGSTTRAVDQDKGLSDRTQVSPRNRISLSTGPGAHSQPGPVANSSVRPSLYSREILAMAVG